MTILVDLKQYLVSNSLASSSEIAFNYYDKNNSYVVLSLYGGSVAPRGALSKISYVQVKVLDLNMQTVQTKIDNIYNSLITADRFKTLNSHNSNIYPFQPPFYIGKDDQGRHAYAFNMSIVSGRNS